MVDRRDVVPKRSRTAAGHRGSGGPTTGIRNTRLSRLSAVHWAVLFRSEHHTPPNDVSINNVRFRDVPSTAQLSRKRVCKEVNSIQREANKYPRKDSLILRNTPLR